MASAVARLAGRRRLPPWPGDVWALFVLVPVTVVVLLAINHDVGNFGAIHFERWNVFDRPPDRYLQTPAFIPPSASLSRGYHGPYHWREDEGFFGRYRTGEWPEWPDGDPGPAAGNALPPKVRRYRELWIFPVYPLGGLCVAWGLWTWRFVRHQRRTRRVRPGFEVIPSSPPAAPPSLTDRGR